MRAVISITAGIWLCAAPAPAQDAQEDDALSDAALADNSDLTSDDDDPAATADADSEPAPEGETATGEGDAESRQAEYEAIVLEALEAYRDKAWSRARRLFQRAHAISPTARTLRTMGMCAFNQGDTVAALLLLERALLDPRKPLTDEQRAHVRELIRRADAKVGRVRLVLEPADAELRVNGEQPELLPDGQLALEPGRYELTLSADGYTSRTQVLRVAAHDRATLELRLEREVLGDLTAPAPSPHGASSPRADTAAREGGSGRGWAWVALSVGVAGAVAGGATAAMALSEKSKLDEVCVDRKCAPADHGRVDEYDTLRTISVISGTVGVLGLAGGALLLWTSGDEPERSPSIEAMIGPGYAGVRGRL